MSMKAMLMALPVLVGCATEPGFELGAYTEFFGPDRIIDQSIDLAGVDALFEINAKVKCAGEDPVSVCIESPTRQWCAGAECSPGRHVDVILNFPDNDLPRRPTRAYISGSITYCYGVWITAIR